MASHQKKLSLCFLSSGDVCQKKIWSDFLSQAPPDRFSVYLHRSDGMSFTWIKGCTIIPHIPTAWGAFSLMRVQQELLKYAHADERNYKFLFLSGDSIPIHTFEVVYQRLILDDDDGRCSKHPDYELPHIRLREIGFHKRHFISSLPFEFSRASQWVLLNRVHAELLFTHWDMLVKVFEDSHCPDEHVYPIFYKGMGVWHTFKQTPTIYVNFGLIQTRLCSLEHRIFPATYHFLYGKELDAIYTSGSMFMRKICPTAKIMTDWNLERPLLQNEPHCSLL